MRKYTEGEVLKHLREQSERWNMTQAALSRKLGFSAQFISDVLNGRRNMTTDLAVSLGFAKVEYYVRRTAVEDASNSL
jgi:plasmid maintenance system antidote protein VapI